MSASGDGYLVDLAELDDTINTIARFERRLEQLLDDADTQARRLAGTWTGEASDRHTDTHRRWSADVTRMQESLAVLRGIASTAHGNYGNAVRANTAMWTQM